MVSGHRAFRGANKISTLSAILHQEPQPLAELAPDLPAELEKIIAEAITAAVTAAVVEALRVVAEAEAERTERRPLPPPPSTT